VDVSSCCRAQPTAALVYHAGRSYYEPLLEAGVKIYERKTRMLHAKSAVVDGVWSTVGSTNLDWRSLLYNDELNAVILGPSSRGQMKASSPGLANSEQSPGQVADRPLEDAAKEGRRAWPLACLSVVQLEQPPILPRCIPAEPRSALKWVRSAYY
jgi:cardiolipin synthase